MLRLLQKKLIIQRVKKNNDILSYFLFVLSLHILLIIAFLYQKNDIPLVLNIKHIQASRQAVVRWSKMRKGPVVDKGASSKKSISQKVAKQATVPPPRKRLTGAFTPAHLGVKIKRKNKRLYQLPLIPVEKEEILKKIPEKVEEVPPVVKPAETVVPEAEVYEPLVLSVHDYNDYQINREIVDAVCRWWQPPLGVENQKNCTIMVKISPSGACQEVTVKESSGIPAYDIAAKSALLKAQFPKILWGKECIFQF